MAVGAAPRLELESLFVGIYADATQYLTTVPQVQQLTRDLNGTLGGLAIGAGQAKKAIDSVTTSMQALGTAIPAAQAGALSSSVAGIISSLQGLQASSVAVGLNNFTKALTDLAAISLSSVATRLKEVGKAFQDSGLWRTNVNKAGLNLSSLATGIKDFWNAVSISTLGSSVDVTVKAVESLDKVFAGSKLHLARVANTALNLTEFSKALTAFSGVDGKLVEAIGMSVSGMLSNVGTGISAAGLHTKSAAKAIVELTNLGAVLSAFPPVDPTKMGGVRAGLLTLFGTKGAADSLEKILLSAGLHTPASKAAVAVGVIKDLADSIRKMATTNISKIGNNLTSLSNILSNVTPPSTVGTQAITALMNDIRTAAAGVNRINVKAFDLRMGSMAQSLKSLANIGTLPDLSGLSAWLNNMATLPQGMSGRILRIAKAIAAMGSGAAVLASTSIAAIVANGNLLLQWINQFGGAAVNPMAVTTLGKLGRALGSFANFLKQTGGAAGALPPIVNNINNITQSAGGASSALGRMGSSIGNASNAAMSATGSFRAFNLSILGISAVGVGVFAKFDDSLTRVMAHMRDWDQVSRPFIQNSLFDISGRSRTGAIDLAHGLDSLTSSGLDAATAIRALGIAESFSVAGGMKMEDASRRLVDLQRTFAMNGATAEEHMRNMAHISDLFVGIAPRVGSSVEQLTSAFGDRFVSAMSLAHMGLEQGIALQAVYSLRGLRGSEASDRAARALIELSKHSVEQAYLWERLGLRVYDTSGNMRDMADIADNLGHVLGHMSTSQQAASMHLMGFEQRAISAILPLVGMGEAFRVLQREIAGVGDITNITAEMMRRSFVGQLKIAWNNVMNLATVIGSHLAPVLGFLSQGLGSLTDWFRSLNRVVQSFIIFGALAYVAIGPLFRLLFSLGSMALAPFVMAFKAVYTILGAILNPIALIRSFLTNITKWLGPILNFFIGMVDTIAGTLAGIVDNVIKPLAVGVWTVLKGMFDFTYAIIKNVAKGIWDILDSLLMIGQSIIAAFATAGVSLLEIIPSLFSILASVVAIAANLLIWGAVVTLLATVFIGLSQLIGLIGAGIVSVWHSVWEAIAIGFEWVVDQWDVFLEAGENAWHGVLESADGFFHDVGEFFTHVVGFFYNFKENMQEIFAFLRRNWRDVVGDMGRIIVAFTGNMVMNFATAFILMKNMLMAFGGYVWTVLSTYFTSVFDWLKGSTGFGMLVEAIGSLFHLLGTNILHNFVTLVPAILQVFVVLATEIARIIGHMVANNAHNLGDLFLPGGIDRAAQRMANGQPFINGLTGQQWRGILDRASGGVQEQFNNLQGLRGPFDDPNNDFSLMRTQFRGIGAGIRLAMSTAASTLEGVQETIGRPRIRASIGTPALPGTSFGPFSIPAMPRTFGHESIPAVPGVAGVPSAWSTMLRGMTGAISQASQAFVSPLDGFVSHLQETLTLNFGLPADPVGTFLETLSRFFRPKVPEGDEHGDLHGKQGPGFQFKQISLQRQMLGGPANESLDYQQLVALKVIADSMQTLIAISRGNVQMPLIR